MTTVPVKAAGLNVHEALTRSHVLGRNARDVFRGGHVGAAHQGQVVGVEGSSDQRRAAEIGSVFTHPGALAFSKHPGVKDSGDALRRIAPPAAERVESWKSTCSELEKRRSQIIERERELTTKQE